MTCDELQQLIPDLVDGSLSPQLLAEAETALKTCPDCQRELEIAQQVHAFLARFQVENAQIKVPAGFEARLIATIRQRSSSTDIVELLSKTFGAWLVELVNLLGGLATSNTRVQISQSH